MAGPVDPATGMVYDLVALDELVGREILERFDESGPRPSTRFPIDLHLYSHFLLKELRNFSSLKRAQRLVEDELSESIDSNIY